MNADILKGVLARFVANLDSRASELDVSSVDASFYYQNGGCDAFAFALKNFLDEHGVDSQMKIISRFTSDRDNELIDENNFSHMVVEAFGTTWDYQGSKAYERWEDEWYEEPGKYTEFSCDDTNAQEILGIRQEKNEQFNATAQDAVFATLKDMMNIDKNPSHSILETCLASHGAKFSVQRPTI